MERFNLLIDGQLLPGDAEMTVINPATGQPLTQCPRASGEQLEAAVAAAKRAFPAWAATPVRERGAALKKPTTNPGQNRNYRRLSAPRSAMRKPNWIHAGR